MLGILAAWTRSGNGVHFYRSGCGRARRLASRHLSFVEAGRSRPSAELVLAVAEHLDVPLRDCNTMLLAAGFAPRYGQRQITDRAMRHVQASLQRMLDARNPYSGVVIDRQ